MWRLLDIGAVDGYTMTNLYEAVGRSVSSGSVPNTVILNHPSKPFVNIGYHQLMEAEINVDYAQKMEFDLVRRTLGGGAILDGPWEQDYFVVVNRKSPDCPVNIAEFYSRFMRPSVATLEKLGLKASIRPPNDILVSGKKISGNGAITIDGANVLAGDLLMDVPSQLMSLIIKAPSEKFQDKLAESMEEWLTSIRAELGTEVSRESIKTAYIESFKNEIGVDLSPGDLSHNEQNCLIGLIEERKTEEWIYGKDLALQELKEDIWATKVRGGITVSEVIHKAGKLIRMTVISEEDVIRGIGISGDFFTIPYMGVISSLEDSLVGVKLEKRDLTNAINSAYEDIGLTVYGVKKGDFVDALLKVKTTS